MQYFTKSAGFIFTFFPSSRQIIVLLLNNWSNLCWGALWCEIIWTMNLRDHICTARYRGNCHDCKNAPLTCYGSLCSLSVVEALWQSCLYFKAVFFSLSLSSFLSSSPHLCQSLVFAEHVKLYRQIQTHCNSMAYGILFI